MSHSLVCKFVVGFALSVVLCLPQAVFAESDHSRGQLLRCTASPRGDFFIDQAVKLGMSGDVLYAMTSGTLTSIDVSDPADPIEISSVVLSSFLIDMVVDGDVAYCLDLDSELHCVDISDPGKMQVLSSFDIPVPPKASFQFTSVLSYVNGYVIVPNSVSFKGHITVIDVSSPASPNHVSTYTVPSGIDISAWGDAAGSSSTLTAVSVIGSPTPVPSVVLLDTTDPSNPVYMSQVFPGSPTEEVAFSGDNMFVMAGSLMMYDVSDPMSPQLVSSTAQSASDSGLAMEGDTFMFRNYMYTLTEQGTFDPAWRVMELSVSYTPQVLVDGVVYSTSSDRVRIFDLNDCNRTCLVDLFPDGFYNFFDISEFIRLYNNQDPLIDLNGDGIVDFFDLSAFVELYGVGC